MSACTRPGLEPSSKHEKMRPTNPLSRSWYCACAAGASPAASALASLAQQQLGACEHRGGAQRAQARACVRTSTWEGSTIMRGWLWYHPITRVVTPDAAPCASASVEAAASCSGVVSTWRPQAPGLGEWPIICIMGSVPACPIFSAVGA